MYANASQSDGPLKDIANMNRQADFTSVRINGGERFHAVDKLPLLGEGHQEWLPIYPDAAFSDPSHEQQNKLGICSASTKFGVDLFNLPILTVGRWWKTC